MAELAKLDLAAICVAVVEDSATIRRLLDTALRAFGVGEVITATDGAEGLSLIRRRRPDLVIVDWTMAGVDGLEMTRRLRASPDPRLRNIPVIMLTGHSDRPRVMMAKETGVSEFAVKPFDAETLYSKIVNVVMAPKELAG